MERDSLSFGLAFAGAVLLAVLSLSFTHQANASAVLSPAQQTQVSQGLEHDAEVMTDTALTTQLKGQPPTVQAEILHINSVARHRGLQVALIIPVLAGLIGLLNTLRMGRLPDPVSSGSSDGVVL